MSRRRGRRSRRQPCQKDFRMIFSAVIETILGWGLVGDFLVEVAANIGYDSQRRCIAFGPSAPSLPLTLVSPCYAFGPRAAGFKLKPGFAKDLYADGCRGDNSLIPAVVAVHILSPVPHAGQAQAVRRRSESRPLARGVKECRQHSLQEARGAVRCGEPIAIERRTMGLGTRTCKQCILGCGVKCFESTGYFVEEEWCAWIVSLATCHGQERGYVCRDRIPLADASAPAG